MAQFYEDEFNPDDLSVKVSELLVATADESDELIDSAVTDVLSLLRERLAMDVVFVSEFVDGQRVFRYVEAQDSTNAPTVGDGDPLETTWCQRVVDGRLPSYIPDVSQFQGQTQLPATPLTVGTYLSTPINLNDGRVYGTLCCYSAGPTDKLKQRDMQNLRSVAQLVARKMERPPPQQAPQTSQAGS